MSLAGVCIQPKIRHVAIDNLPEDLLVQTEFGRGR